MPKDLFVEGKHLLVQGKHVRLPIPEVGMGV